jgi:transcriptional regulator with XRE-family HTH domain
MQPYSIDLRKKIIKVRQQENISIRKLAERFNVAKSFAQKLLKRFGSSKYVVIEYLLPQSRVVMMDKIPNSTNMIF